MRLISGLLGLALMSGSALAADLLEPVVPVEPVIVPEAFSWTGGYVGLNAGWAFDAEGDDDDDLFDDDHHRFGWRRHNDHDLNGPFVGAQAGFNYQAGMFVVGVEGDIQWANIDSDDDDDLDDGRVEDRHIFTGRVGRIFNRGVFQNCEARGNCDADFTQRVAGNRGWDGDAEIDWFGTLRLRGGIALDRALIYATGGLAFGDGDQEDAFHGAGGGWQRATARQVNRPALGGGVAGRLLVRERVRFGDGGGFGDDDGDGNWGYSLGGGVEYAITDNVTVKAEYQYINLSDGLFGDDDDDNGDAIRVQRQFTFVGTGRFNGVGREPIRRRNEFVIHRDGDEGEIDFHTLRLGVNVLF